jgi:hypothetical protein
MKLKEKLSLAVCTLLSVGQTQAADTFIDFSVLNYHEEDDQNRSRVSVFEPVLSVTTKTAEDDFIKYDLVFDSLTGSSPNGANASSQVQDIAGLTTQPGYTPLDSRFNDNRLSLNVSWMTPIDRLSRYQAGFSLSEESDYRSAGVDYSYFQDTQNKLTTLMYGLAFSYDAINPTGGFVDPFQSITSMTSASKTSPGPDNLQTLSRASGGATTTTPVNGTTGTNSREEDDDGEGDGGETSLDLFPGKPKLTYQAIIGISHIYNRHTLLNLNYGLSLVDGYQTDPYKLITIINNDASSPDYGKPVDYVWEKRPNTRIKQTIKGSLVTAIGNDSLHLDYRYYQDDWGIVTHTYDVKYNLELGDKLTITPHYRMSNQSKADFYKISLNGNDTTPNYASADYRLADMDTKTSGAMIAYHMNPKLSWTLNMEKISQTGDSYPAEAIGDQKLNDMFPDLEFWAITVGVRGLW